MITARQEPEKFILNVEDVAQILGVSRMAVYMMIRRHGLPARKMGRKVFFHKQELEQWLLSQPYAYAVNRKK